MQRIDRLLRSVDRVQQRSRWLGFPLAVMRRFGDDNGGALATVVAYNAFLALFPLLLVVVTVLGFLLGRDSGFRQRLLAPRWPSSPSSGSRCRTTSRGCAAAGSAWWVGLVAFAWGARGLTQVAQHAMAEILSIPGRAATQLLGRAGPCAAAGGLCRRPGCVEPADLAWQLRREGGRGGTR
jgi:uncharacterized BrkB/YihY/UPF0761 family membrane protein